MSKRKTPVLRFKGFHNDWEQRKLGDIAKRIVRKNKNLKSTLVLTISAQYGLVDQKKFFNKNIAGKNIAKYYLIEKGEFAYNKSYSKGHPLGVIKRLDYYDVGILSTLYIIFKPENINSNFLSAYYDTKCWYKEVTKYAAEGARNHGLLNIPTQDFFKTELIITTNNKEQQRIGNIIKIVNKILDLQERKYEELKLLKKALMQNMFADNAFYPNLRFKGFVYKWKQYKLNDLGYTFSGLSGKSKKDFGHGKAQYVTYMNVFSNPIANLEMTEHIEIDNKQNSVKYNDIFFTTSSETPEEVGMSSIWLGKETNTYLNSFCFGFRLTKRIDSYYIAFMLRSPSFRRKMMVLAQGISRFNISKNKVMNIKILLPKISEQKRVGITIKKVDNTVKLQVKFINKIKKFRKFLLQNMFI